MSWTDVPTGSLLMVCASCSVSFWDIMALPTILICKPSTAATILPAATMDGGLAMNLTSAEHIQTFRIQTFRIKDVEQHRSLRWWRCVVYGTSETILSRRSSIFKRQTKRTLQDTVKLRQDFTTLRQARVRVGALCGGRPHSNKWGYIFSALFNMSKCGSGNSSNLIMFYRLHLNWLNLQKCSTDISD